MPYNDQGFVPNGPMQEMEDPEAIGAIKIKDGLFIGDHFASQVSFF